MPSHSVTLVKEKSKRQKYRDVKKSVEQTIRLAELEMRMKKQQQMLSGSSHHHPKDCHHGNSYDEEENMTIKVQSQESQETAGVSNGVLYVAEHEVLQEQMSEEYLDYHDSSSSNSNNEGSQSSLKKTVLQNPNNPKDFLTNWALNNNISHTALSQLLTWLQTNPNMAYLPKDARSLLRTPRHVELQTMEDGLFYYFGIKNNITSLAEKYGDTNVTYELDFNVDGLPIHKSTREAFWPILCRIKNHILDPPFPVAIYCGSKKPPLTEFFNRFVVELTNLLEDGISLENRKIRIVCRSFCCDTPAKAFVKNIKAHNGYHGCDKCYVKGEYTNKRITFCDLDATLRSDECFSEKVDQVHHKDGDTPLSDLNIGLVTTFPVDYMHAVCLGVTKKMLFIWRDYGSRLYRLTGDKIKRIDERIDAIKKGWPTEFNRKPRSLKGLEHWKATEYRQFMLYLVPVIMYDMLPESVYCNFLLLQFGMTILLSPNLNKQYNSYANELLRLFIKHAVHIYGKEFCVYNVHSLIHLANDAKVFGCLETISCFPFENYLGSLKHKLRKSNQSLQQVVKRITEINERNSVCEKSGNEVTHWISKNIRVHISNGQFSIFLGHCKLTSQTGNNYAYLKNGEICAIQHVIEQNDETLIHGFKIDIIKSFLKYPEDSTFLSWKAFVVVEFPEEKENDVTTLAVVSYKWIINESGYIQCMWPTYFKTDMARLKAVRNHADLRYDDCIACAINIKYSSDDYQMAMEKLKYLEECTSLSSQSEIEGGQLKKRRSLKSTRYPSDTFQDAFYTAISEDDDLYPIPRAPKLFHSLPQESGHYLPTSKIVSKKSTARNHVLRDMPSSGTEMLSKMDNESVQDLQDELTPIDSIECFGCVKNGVLLEKVLKKVEAISREVQYLSRTIQEQKEGNVEVIGNSWTAAKTKEELMNLHKVLGDDARLADACHTLQTVGGKDLAETTRRVMTRLLSHELALTCNWTGQHNNFSFCNMTNIHKLILLVVRKNRASRDATEPEVLTVIKTWLRQAPDREGGRSLRNRL